MSRMLFLDALVYLSSLFATFLLVLKSIITAIASRAWLN
jgi:hypothetical protein